MRNELSSLLGWFRQSVELENVIVLGGALFLGESVNAGTVAGGGLMLISIALARSER